MNTNENPIVSKSYSFALRMIKCYQYLITEKQPYDLARQILKSGTSIGANVEESQGGQSKKDFISKIHIAYKEARETHYWLRLLNDSKILEPKLANSLIQDCEELLKILTSILKSSKN